MNAPLVSVVMPLYNSAPFVRAAVESILAQTFRDFELLVVDDGSTDGGPAVVDALRDPRIRLLRQEMQRGPAAARNRALDEARGKFIGFFDSDDVARPTWLAEAMDFFAAHPDSDIVGSWLEVVDENGAPTGDRIACPERAEKIASIMLFANCLSTSTLFLRRACIGGRRFDETLPVASDYDLWAELAPSHRTSILRKVLGQYRAHPQNITHRKTEVTGECLGRVARGQIERLGLTPTDGEISLHLQISRFTFGTSREAVLAVEHWLRKLEEANGRTGVYPPSEFREVLGERWFTVCHTAGGLGFWTWKRFRGSPLARWFAPSSRQHRHLLYRCLRGAGKKLLTPIGRSKPCAE